jgi:TRAP-type uncharacterized transport system fused permease subunit
MRTAFVSWKLAKGLYIIPIVMAYRPLLGNGPWPEVLLTIVTCAAGLVAFAAALDRYFLRRATPIETLLLVLSAICLFLPDLSLSGSTRLPGAATDVIGAALLAGVILHQKLHAPAAASRGAS